MTDSPMSTSGINQPNTMENEEYLIESGVDPTKTDTNVDAINAQEEEKLYTDNESSTGFKYAAISKVESTLINSTPIADVLHSESQDDKEGIVSENRDSLYSAEGEHSPGGHEIESMHAKLNSANSSSNQESINTDTIVNEGNDIACDDSRAMSNTSEHDNEQSTLISEGSDLEHSKQSHKNEFTLQMEVEEKGQNDEKFKEDDGTNIKKISSGESLNAQGISAERSETPKIDEKSTTNSRDHGNFSLEANDSDLQRSKQSHKNEFTLQMEVEEKGQNEEKFPEDDGTNIKKISNEESLNAQGISAERSETPKIDEKSTTNSQDHRNFSLEANDSDLEHSKQSHKNEFTLQMEVEEKGQNEEKFPEDDGTNIKKISNEDSLNAVHYKAELNSTDLNLDLALKSLRSKTTIQSIPEKLGSVQSSNEGLNRTSTVLGQKSSPTDVQQSDEEIENNQSLKRRFVNGSLNAKFSNKIANGGTNNILGIVLVIIAALIVIVIAVAAPVYLLYYR